MLYFSHSKFSDSKETLFRMNFVSETKTNLSSSEGHLTVVVFKKSLEVNEDTLSSLRSHITSSIT
jgi:hypothetical protein